MINTIDQDQEDLKQKAKEDYAYVGKPLEWQRGFDAAWKEAWQASAQLKRERQASEPRPSQSDDELENILHNYADFIRDQIESAGRVDLDFAIKSVSAELKQLFKPQPTSQDGFVLVPLEPTIPMLEQLFGGMMCGNFGVHDGVYQPALRKYKAMLKAAMKEGKT